MTHRIRDRDYALGDARSQFERFERTTDLPLAILALLIVPALVLEERAQSAYLRETAVAINWIVWLAFCVEYVGKLALSPSRRDYIRNAWFDLNSRSSTVRTTAFSQWATRFGGRS